MKKVIISLLFLAVSVISLGSNQWIGINKNTPSPARTELVSSQSDRSIVHFSIDGFMMKEVQTPRGLSNIIMVDEATPAEEKGNPDLPKLVTALAIPDLAEMEYTILSADYTDYPNVLVAPSKGVISRTEDPATVPFTYGRSYSMNAFWPDKTAGISDPYIIRDVRGQNIIVYPFHYNPVTKTLRVYHDITVELKKKSDAGKNPLTRKAPASNEFQALQQHHFLNKGILSYNPLNDYGKILVICHDAFISSMEPYVDWKNSCGFPTKIVGTSVTGTTAS
ncbi:MAG: C25 family peptidase propeptide domain-containing protein, partial [Syntrophothermus sp.]